MTIYATSNFGFISKVSDAPCDTLKGVDIAFVGLVVDDRGTATTNALKTIAVAVHSFRFDASKHMIYLDEVETRLDRVASEIQKARRVLLDTTTLGIGEILQILLAVNRAGLQAAEFLYTEPKMYTKHQSAAGHHAQQRDFKLTTNCKFSSVQGFAHEYDPSRMAAHIFLLGFEPARLLNAIEQRDYNQGKTRFHAIVGVPAFQCGWESDSIRPHLSVLEELDIRESSISYCQANSIREAYLTLWDLYRSLGDEQGCFYVSPLGTKPHGVGAALFLLETKSSDVPTSLYYDHPERLQRRSSDVGAWHHVIVHLRKSAATGEQG